MKLFYKGKVRPLRRECNNLWKLFFTLVLSFAGLVLREVLVSALATLLIERL